MLLTPDQEAAVLGLFEGTQPAGGERHLEIVTEVYEKLVQRRAWRNRCPDKSAELRPQPA